MRAVATLPGTGEPLPCLQQAQGPACQEPTPSFPEGQGSSRGRTEHWHSSVQVKKLSPRPQL